MGRVNDLNGGDYSRPRDRAPIFRPHDLVQIAPEALPDDAPAWARAVLANGEPVVVRRGRRDGNRLPVGVRGASRDRRHALQVAPEHICGAVITPESLVESAAPQRAADVPALAALVELRALMTPWAGAWGIGGAVGYELASGVAACHEDSDIDLLLRLLERPDTAALRRLAAQLAELPVRCDLQMETPAGGVALADWLSEAADVLVKSDQGPYLAADPWRRGNL
ncbi:phosphoribosyl-dephospho-CoA transferase [Salinisphaera hydrothermalis EPR70]